MARNLILFLILTLAANHLAAKNYYRYKDQTGRLVVKDYLPNEAVKNGYDVINEQGRVLEQVPALLTDEQQQAEKIKQQQLAEQAEKRREQRRKDMQLMRQYNTVEDIERSEESQTASLKINMDIVRSHSAALENKLTELQSRAANFERKGKPVPKNILVEIESVKNQLSANQASLEQYQQRVTTIQEQFHHDLLRFKELKAMRLVKQSQYDSDFQDDDLIFSCSDKSSCDKAWKYAQIFAHENGSNKLEVVTDTLIITGKPQNQDQIGLSMTRLPGENESMQIVLEIDCFNSAQGQSLCNSDKALLVRQKFVDYLTQKSL
ncbi:MAG: hypothetical protein HWD86_08130 [Kangiellaceae bacterium]|nr:hypothetical protein [Kangiellaceae bacterium]